MRPIRTIALLLTLPAGAASAQGIALFGDARLGLGYNIEDDGAVLVDDDGSAPDTLRAVSRVRFGVVMTGLTDNGIVFGASIRADNAAEGEGGSGGQIAGDVFVSGAWGSLTYGDTDGADEQWVGEVPGNYSLTGLTDIEETRFISNGGSFGEEDGANFAENPEALPTLRYDYGLGGFGFSLSTDRSLGDVGVGAGYAGDIGEGSWSVGVGYYRFAAFEAVGDSPLSVDPTAVPGGEQWSAGVNLAFDPVELGVTYVKLSSDEDGTTVEAENLVIGGSLGSDAWSVGAFWGKVLSAEGPADLARLDGDDGFGVTAEYDLGGGATINGGIARSYPISAGDDASATVADFGVSMEF